MLYKFLFILPYFTKNSSEIHKNGFIWSFHTLIVKFIANHLFQQDFVDSLFSLFSTVDNISPKLSYQITMLTSYSILSKYSVDDYFIDQMIDFSENSQVQIYQNLSKALTYAKMQIQEIEPNDLNIDDLYQKDFSSQPYTDENDKEDFEQCICYTLP